MKKLLFFPVCFLILGVSPQSFSQTQALEWKTFTNVGAISDIAAGNGVVWSGSNGGALKLTVGDQRIEKFTNTEGLSANQVVAVEIDAEGTVWFALFDGVLNRYFPDEDRWQVVEDYRTQVITDIVSFGDSLYIGLDIGVSLYTVDKSEVKETYTNLGLSTGSNLEKIGANSVQINGQDIWVATNRGIAQSSLTLSNLQAPASWRQHSVANGLPTNTVNKVVVLNDIAYAATDLGVFRLVNDRWELVGNLDEEFTKLEVADASSFFPQQTLVACSATGVYWLNSSGEWQRLGPALTDATALSVDAHSDVWIGRRSNGLNTFDFTSGQWRNFEVDSPRSNNFRALALDSQGRLWCASEVVAGLTGGVQMFDGESWSHFSRPDGLKSDDQRALTIDTEGRIIFGSWGGGMSVFNEVGAGFEIVNIDTTDGILAGSTSPGFVLINGLATDLTGSVWALNRQADNTRVLVAFTPEGDIAYFSTSEGLITPFVEALIIDQANRVWIATQDRGVRVLDHRNTLFDKTDDNFDQGLTVADGLFTNQITALAEDRDGVIWIGSEEGVNFWFSGNVFNQFGLINDFVNTIGVDGRNNKWFGTATGVSVLANDGVTWTHFTTGNSPLVSGNVQSFAFNPETGEVWIGTTDGLSLLQTPFTAAQEDLSQLTGFPNPFIIDGNARFFTVTNLAENSSVAIFSASGKRLRTYNALDIQGAQVFWDGRDEDGALVASGVYVYLAYTDGNLSATGKVAVIRR